MNLSNNNNFQSPNDKLTHEYNELIKNNPDEFFAKLDKGQIDQSCLSKTQQKIVKKRQKQKSRRNVKYVLKTLWSFLVDYKMLLVFLIFSTIALTVLNTLATFGLRELTQLVNYVQPGWQENGTQVSSGNASPNFLMLSVYGIVLIVFYFFMAAFMWWQTRISTIIAQKAGYSIRKKLFAKIQRLPVKYFDQNSSGDLMSKFTNDINNITNALSQNTTILLNGVFMALSMLISMFLLSAYLALIMVALVPLMFIPLLIMVKKSQPLFKENQKTLGELNGFVEEMISGQSIISYFNQEDEVIKNFSTINRKMEKTASIGQALTSWIFTYAHVFQNASTVIAMIVGVVFVVKGIDFAGVPLSNVDAKFIYDFNPVTNPEKLEQLANINDVISKISIIATFTMMSRNFFLPFAQIANIATTLQLAFVGATRSFAVFEEQEEIKDYEKVILNIAQNSFTTIKDNDVTTNSSVKVEDLNFNYVPNKQILFDVNIDAKEGQTIAIVGPTGSGKSTFINLLTKFYDIENGDIKIGGDVSIKEITKESMRRNVSIVLQDTYLFNVSIKQNIRYGKMDATDEEVIQAAKTANAHNFIMQLPNGYDTVLEDNGESLSQGQRQLLAIARAILAPSSILILDEATSSIDTKTEIEIQTAMLRLMKNKTSFVIAHRLSTIQNADQILVLKDGHIIERGTHQELLDFNGFYANLYNSQFYEEE